MMPAETEKRLFIFNPDCELAIANGGYFYTPPAHIVKMAEDLAFLPAWLGKDGEGVLVKEKPDAAFVESVCSSLALRRAVVREEELGAGSGFRAEPWGWSPKMCRWLAKRGMGEEWKPERKEWYSRKTAREGLRRLFGKIPGLEPSILPEVCGSVEEMEGRVYRRGRFLVKAPWSSSGKGLLALADGVASREREWLAGMFRRQGYLMLEKRLERVKDFAMEFYAGTDGVVFIGWSLFYTGEKGEYRGNFVGPQAVLEQELADGLGRPLLECLKVELPEMLKGLLPFYRGYLGVDMMIYRNPAGQLHVHPCVEINLRYNMGIVALAVSRNYLACGTCGRLEIVFYPRPGEAWLGHRHFRRESPAIYKNNRIASGYLNLTPVSAATQFVASLRCY